jgi:dTDP-4-amino-4,6-dideoxygalactose transaminase
MTELQAALGVSQLNRLDDYVRRRHALARRYDTLLAPLPVVAPWQHPDGYSGLHLYVIRLRRDRIRANHRLVIDTLRGKGIGVNLHYIPLHTQPYYRAMGFEVGDFPEADAYYADAISLPMYPTMTERQQMKLWMRCTRPSRRETGRHSGTWRQQTYPAEEHPVILRQADDRVVD